MNHRANAILVVVLAVFNREAALGFAVYLGLCWFCERAGLIRTTPCGGWTFTR